MHAIPVQDCLCLAVSRVMEAIRTIHEISMRLLLRLHEGFLPPLQRITASPSEFYPFPHLRPPQTAEQAEGGIGGGRVWL